MSTKKKTPQQDQPAPIPATPGLIDVSKPQPLSPPPEEGIGERVRKERKNIGLSVQDLSRLTAEYDYWAPEGKRGISPSMLSRYEKPGGFKPGAREIGLLCAALKVSADWLVLGVVQQPRSTTLQDVFEQEVRRLINLGASGESILQGVGSGWEQIERAEKLRRARTPGKGK